MERVSNGYLTWQLFLKNVPANGRKQASYWEKAFELAGIPNDNGHDGGDDVSDDGSDDGSDGCFDLDTLIISLKEKIITESGSVKYPMLLSLFKSVASFYHGNSAPENGFCMKFIIGIRGNSIQADTIEADTMEALRMVTDTILSHGSIGNVPITKGLLESVKLAKQRCNHDLGNKRKLK